MRSLEGQTELVSLSGLVRLHRTTVVQSSVLGHPRSSSPRLDLDTISASVQCTEAREESHVARHRARRARRARTRRLQRLLGRPRLDRDFSGYLRIPHDLNIPHQRWYCMAVFLVWIGLGMFGGIGYLGLSENRVYSQL